MSIASTKLVPLPRVLCVLWDRYVGYVTHQTLFTLIIHAVKQEGLSNPYDDVESFDTIYYAALQVFIVSSANGVSTLGIPPHSKF